MFNIPIELIFVTIVKQRLTFHLSASLETKKCFFCSLMKPADQTSNVVYRLLLSILHVNTFAASVCKRTENSKRNEGTSEWRNVVLVHLPDFNSLEFYIGGEFAPQKTSFACFSYSGQHIYAQ